MPRHRRPPRDPPEPVRTEARRNVVRALVVYETVFGNTREVGDAIARALTSWMPVTLVEVTTAPPTLPRDVTLLVAGGPTHAFGLSRPSTRRDAAHQAGHDYDPDTVGLREWLDGLEPARRVVAAATFDTRVRQPRLPGSAAHRAAARLRHLGFVMLGAPTTFWVAATPGPLPADELELAFRWGEQLGAWAAPVQGRADGGSAVSG